MDTYHIIRLAMAESSYMQHPGAGDSQAVDLVIANLDPWLDDDEKELVLTGALMATALLSNVEQAREFARRLLAGEEAPECPWCGEQFEEVPDTPEWFANVIVGDAGEPFHNDCMHSINAHRARLLAKQHGVDTVG